MRFFFVFLKKKNTHQSRDPEKREIQNLISLRRVRYHYTDVRTANYSETSSRSLLATVRNTRATAIGRRTRTFLAYAFAERVTKINFRACKRIRRTRSHRMPLDDDQTNTFESAIRFL